jgi:hypothetical protein
MNLPNPPRDSAGNPVGIGMQAKIATIPGWLTHDLPEEDAAALESLRGAIMRIIDIDAYGYVWFGSADGSPWFCLQPSDILVNENSGK